MIKEFDKLSPGISKRDQLDILDVPIFGGKFNTASDLIPGRQIFY